MNDHRLPIDQLLLSLRERAKELNCYYAVQDLLKIRDLSIDQICNRLLDILPPGFRHPEITRIRIAIGNSFFCSRDMVDTPWMLSVDILLHNRVVGYISVYYAVEVEAPQGHPFLPEESRLLQAVAERLGSYLSHRLDWKLADDRHASDATVPIHEGCEWQIVLDSINRADPYLHQNITRKMLNYLCWSGLSEAEQLLQSFHPDEPGLEKDDYRGDWHTPRRGHSFGFTEQIGSRIFDVAVRHLDPDQIMALIQSWVNENKQSFLIQLANPNSPTSLVANVLQKFHQLTEDPSFVPITRTRGILIALIRRFLSENKGYIDVARDLITVDDFHHLMQKTVYNPESHGRLGGKAAGLYLAAQIVKKKGRECQLLQDIKTPKTWHITSDVLFHFIHHCNFDELVDQKYKPIHQVRLEFPCISQAFKSITFPSDITSGLAAALDDFGTNPIIVRSSSLLEDSVGSAFSGKYRSLFLANQGSKRRRLQALTDAITEVYASTFGPDPIEYRADRGLLDYNEEMGVLIQEVVGKKIGRYFLPAFAGVVFSRNDYRWSPRIKREDGLLRIVPGLGTRAVDRLSNDYPVLFSPGQPNIRVNITPEAVCRYSPRQIDVINLDTESFQTVDIDSFLADTGNEFPQFSRVFSVVRDDHISDVNLSTIDPEKEKFIATFNGLVARTPFIGQIQALLNILEETLGFPVDIEFASDGTDLYLLQCRAQSSTEDCSPEPIPKEIPPDRILFTARRNVPNGYIPDITHIVYVDPAGYASLNERSQLLAVGQVIGKLNDLLPRRRFILMGPGRWGSRGDIKLGVSVEYSSINNTAMLIEIARARGDYMPEPSYGTHFFQDLVEARIYYLPLYPEEEGIVFNEPFLHDSENLLPDFLPGHADLAGAVKVIDIEKATGGLRMCVAMNADEDRALAFFRQSCADRSGS